MIVITADEQLRDGKPLALKAIVDEGIALDGCNGVRDVIVYRRPGGKIAWHLSRDKWMHEVTEGKSDTCEPEWVDAEHPHFLLYTSGSTGGYLLHAAVTTTWTFDLHDDDVFWCAADIGWVTGHTYIACGPLAIGATQVAFVGVPTTRKAGGKCLETEVLELSLRR